MERTRVIGYVRVSTEGQAEGGVSLEAQRAKLVAYCTALDLELVAVEVDADRIRDALYRQAFGPVRWVECVRAIKAHGIVSVVECGPGKVLAGMVRRIDPEMNGMALLDPGSLAEVKRELVGDEHE